MNHVPVPGYKQSALKFTSEDSGLIDLKRKTCPRPDVYIIRAAIHLPLCLPSLFIWSQTKFGPWEDVLNSTVAPVHLSVMVAQLQKYLSRDFSWGEEPIYFYKFVSKNEYEAFIREKDGEIKLEGIRSPAASTYWTQFSFPAVRIREVKLPDVTYRNIVFSYSIVLDYIVADNPGYTLDDSAAAMGRFIRDWNLMLTLMSYDGWALDIRSLSSKLFMEIKTAMLYAYLLHDTKLDALSYLLSAQSLRILLENGKAPADISRSMFGLHPKLKVFSGAQTWDDTLRDIAKVAPRGEHDPELLPCNMSLEEALEKGTLMVKSEERVPREPGSAKGLIFCTEDSDWDLFLDRMEERMGDWVYRFVKLFRKKSWTRD